MIRDAVVVHLNKGKQPDLDQKGPPMFTANYDDSTFSYWISETDAEGVGEQKFQIRSVSLDKNLQLVEQVSRLVLMALNMGGGVDHALALLRAEVDRQRA